jgi:imidazolonepropionase
MTDGAVLTPTLVTASGHRPPLRGGALGTIEAISDGAIAWRDGLITYAGPADGLAAEGLAADGPEPVRVQGAVVPGFVDSHTHLPFVGWRADEFQARLAGKTYRDIHGGGGIFRSARMFAEASEEEILAFCRPLAMEMLAHGTTALELKTGYGLSVRDELRQAWIARQLALEIPQATTVTLLACHAIPPDRTAAEWVEDVCERLIPQAASDSLIDAVDVYVEDIAFSLEDLARVARVARAFRLPVRCHADQLGPSGAAEAAAALGARSADHLNHVSAEGVRALGGGETAAVLLPVSTLFLRAPAPPVSDLMAAGAAVVLATDFNPGTSPCLSMPEAIAVAASLYRLHPMAAIGAATLNGAWVLGLDDQLGSLEPGKRADFVVLDSPDVAMVPYRPGHNPVAETWIRGERVYGG